MCTVRVAEDDYSDADDPCLRRQRQNFSFIFVHVLMLS